MRRHLRLLHPNVRGGIGDLFGDDDTDDSGGGSSGGPPGVPGSLSSGGQTQNSDGSLVGDQGTSTLSGGGQSSTYNPSSGLYTNTTTPTDDGDGGGGGGNVSPSQPSSPSIPPSPTNGTGTGVPWYLWAAGGLLLVGVAVALAS